jgi:hypothetical protein
MRTYCVFLWNSGFRHYKAEHVNVLAHAIQYFDPDPHRFVCITDEKGAFSPAVEVMPMPRAAKALAHLSAPQGRDFPASYRRLWLFSEAAKAIGERIMLLDVDAMVVGDLRPLWNVDANFVGWRPMSIWGKENRIGGGTWLLKTGKLAWIWERFIKDPQKMIDETKAMGWNGSDQAILSRYLHNKYPVWPQMCGIYGSQDGLYSWDLPPKDARILHSNGEGKAWDCNKLWMVAYHNRFRDYCNSANK